MQLTLTMMTSSRSVYQGFRQRGPLVDTGEVGRYRNATTAMRQVSRPSSRKSQNQPGLPPMPRISRIPAASRADMTLAMFRVDQKAASRRDSSFDL